MQENELQHEYKHYLSELNSEWSWFYACLRWVSIQFKVGERRKKLSWDQEREPLGLFKSIIAMNIKWKTVWRLLCKLFFLICCLLIQCVKELLRETYTITYGQCSFQFHIKIHIFHFLAISYRATEKKTRERNFIQQSNWTEIFFSGEYIFFQRTSHLFMYWKIMFYQNK